MITFSIEIKPPPVRRSCRTDAETRAAAKVRREELTAAGLCINGTSHGSATHGVRCKRCYDVHRGGEPPPREARTHCRHGHEFTPENTRIDKYDRKQCRTCHRIRGACQRKGWTREQFIATYGQLTRGFISAPDAG